MKLLLNVLLLLNIFQPSYASVFDIPASQNTSKIVVIADIHSDIYRFKQILRDANILDNTNRWIAEPNTVVIQLGDQIDPKEPEQIDHHFKMIYLTNTLEHIAKQSGSKFISLIGNHELYNIDKIRRKDKLREIISGRPIVHKEDRYIFCHGGFHKRHLYLLDMYNKSIDDLQDIWNKYVNELGMDMIEEIILDRLILDRNNSILFTRQVDTPSNTDILTTLMDIDYIFVGHTTIEYITLNYKVWFLDMYLKDAFDKMNYAYIVISNNRIIVKDLSF